jgi:hypothetical protein
MVTTRTSPERPGDEERARRSRRLGVGLALAGLGLWVGLWLLIFYVRGDLDRMLQFPGKPEAHYRVGVWFQPPAGQNQVEFLFPAPLMDGQMLPGFREALGELEPPVEIVNTELGSFVRLTTENLDESGGLGLDVTIPVDKREVGALVSLRFTMSGASQNAADRYWIYVDSDGLQSAITMVCSIGPARAEQVLYVSLRLNRGPQTPCWTEVQGE